MTLVRHLLRSVGPTPPLALRCSQRCGLSQVAHLARAQLHGSHGAPRQRRDIHATTTRLDRSFTNILADDNPPPVQVQAITEEGIQLADGLLLPSATIFLEGRVFLWDVPRTLWNTWGEKHFEVFDVVVPKPEILLLGTGKTLSQPPPFLRKYLNGLGIQLEVMDTRNACSTYNLLSEEGRRVAAALLPYSQAEWRKSALLKH